MKTPNGNSVIVTIWLLSLTSLCGADVSDAEKKEASIMLPGNIPLILVHISPGTCTMRCYPDEHCDADDEELQYEATVARPYYLGRHEVTQAQWRAVMETRPSYFTGGTLPVERVSWSDAQHFLEILNKHIAETGQGPLTVRLPSETEWEYACCEGASAHLSGNMRRIIGQIGNYAWYEGNSNGMPRPVGRKTANAFGLYDMSGNVWEWCEDDWHNSRADAPADGSALVNTPRGTSRALRGGSWLDFDWVCQCTVRIGYSPATRLSNLGFRIAATVQTRDCKPESEEALQSR